MTLAQRTPRSPWPTLALTVLAAVAATGWSYAVFQVASAQGNGLAAGVVVAALPVALGILGKPQLAFAALAAALISNAGLVLNAEFGVPSVVRASILLGAVAAALHPVARRRMLDLHPVMLALLAFVAVRVGTSLAAPIRVDIPALGKELAFGVLIVGLLGLAASRPAWAEWTAWTLAASGAVLCVVAFARQHGFIAYSLGFAEPPPLSDAEIQILARSLEPLAVGSRTGGPVAEPNFWAQILVLTLPLAIWCMRSSVPGQRIAGGALTLAIAVGIVETGSRGGLLSLAVALAVLGIVTGGRARRAVILIPIVLGIGLVASGNMERFQQIGDLVNVYESDDSALRGRASENIAALEMLGDHPVTGVGADNYPTAYLDYAPSIGLDDRTIPREAHNSYLEMAAESGLPGAGAFLALFAVALVGPFRSASRLRRDGRTREADLAIAVGAGFAGYCLAAVFLHQGFPEYGWLALGLCAMATNLGGTAARTRGGLVREMRALRHHGRDGDSRLPVAWLVRGFPATADDPVVEEVVELDRQGARIEVFPLGRLQAAGLGPEAAAIAGRAHFVRRLSPGTLGAQFYWLWRAPRAYLGVWRIATRRGWRHPRRVVRAIGLVPVAARFARRMRRIGVVHQHVHGGVDAALAARIVERLAGVPYSVAVTRPDLVHESARLEEALRSARFVAAPTEGDAAILARSLGPTASGGVVVARTPVDLAPYPYRAHVAAGAAPVRVLCVGPLHERSGHVTVLQAMSVLARSGLPTRLDVAGDGEARATLAALAERFGVSDTVTFHGRLSDGDMLGLMDRAHAVVVPTAVAQETPEAATTLVARAMARGLAAVVPDVGGVAEIVADGRTGLRVPPGDVGALAHAVRRLSTDTALRARLAEAGAAEVRRTHDAGEAVAALRDRISAEIAVPRPARGARRR